MREYEGAGFLAGVCRNNLAGWRLARHPEAMRGYFGIGVEGISKPMNAGNLFRSAHAFGASFIFTIDAGFSYANIRSSDTSDAPAEVPLHEYASLAELTLPKGCRLVGVELTDDAQDLPSFRHPRQAAYVLGPERGSLSPALLARCEYVIKIPTKFCINVATAGAIIMYDRLLNLGRYAARPVMEGGVPIAPPPHVAGAPKRRRTLG
ncbi:MAG: tRNA G18 (ribose-2'-O)-methylase SpoU [Alphaproteobacteria bacterium]